MMAKSAIKDSIQQDQINFLKEGKKEEGKGGKEEGKEKW